MNKMSTYQKKRLSIFILTVVIIFSALLAVSGLNFTKPANADVTVSGSDDTFEMTHTSYQKDESFVFSATVNFINGQAAGLAFGCDLEREWVFNVDRRTNSVKLMYFDYTSGEKVVTVLEEEYYIGPSNMNEGEKQYFAERLQTRGGVSKVYLKIVITPEAGDKVFAEFYADGIRRFAYANGSEEARTINLNDYSAGSGENRTSLTYAGGYIGYNCFNAEIRFTDIETADSDYSYYSEPYRNRYHFSQFSRWNNDPNGLVYYNGYYHLYYQNNPYGNTWDDMHWGHARSNDLVHWELLPVALVPDYDLPEGDDKLLGCMWSGSAMVYHKGDSSVIDGATDDWFGDISAHPNGTAEGLIGFYSWWNGNGGNRYQVVMFSTDGGLTWNKRNNINRDIVYENVAGVTVGGSWRDPKVFRLSEFINGDTGEYKWGMALTNMEDNVLYFLKSKDILNWEHAGAYTVYRPECPDVLSLGGHTVITFTARYYVVCDLKLENGLIAMYDLDGHKIESLKRNDPLYHNQGMDTDDPRLRKMDYGVDSYAMQTFYIDSDSDSAYAGKAVGLSWFSGVPNVAESIESGVLQNARKIWNGGGMTIPVVLNLSGDTLTTTPITRDECFSSLKTNVVDIENEILEGDPLSHVGGHSLEIYARLSNPTQNPVSIKVNKSADGSRYTEIGWNKQEGYFVDRTHTDDAGIDYAGSNRFGGYNNYAVRYPSNLGKDNVTLEFYILVDNNNVEVYCDGFTIPFYIITFAAPSAKYASFTAGGDITVRQFTVNSPSSIWREDSDFSSIILSETSLSLDGKLTPEKKITADAEGEVEWTVTSGQDCIELVPVSDGVIVKAVNAGSATIKAACGGAMQTVSVTVYSGSLDCGYILDSDDIISGSWYYSGSTLVGEQTMGDGFILSKEIKSDFIYTASFDLGTGAAAALVFRAEEVGGRLTSYVIANYDNYGHVVKLWSHNGEIARAENIYPEDIHDIRLSANVDGASIKVALDGRTVIEAILGDNEPVSGRIGLNICATRATFYHVSVKSLTAAYSGGNLQIEMAEEQYVSKVINKTLNNTEVNREFLTFENSSVIISESYMALLPSTGVYVFTVRGENLAFDITVTVTSLPVVTVQPVTIYKGANAVLYVGNIEVGYVYVNGTAISTAQYSINNYILTINGSVFNVGENTVKFGSTTVTVTVNELPSQEMQPNEYSVYYKVNLPQELAASVINMPSDTTAEAGKSLQKPLSPTLEGYVFGGWYTDSNCTSEYSFASEVASPLTLYAKWTKQRTQFNVSYVANLPEDAAYGVSGMPANSVISLGEQIEKPQNPQLYGYIFIDWYVDAEGTARFDFSNKIRSDILLYAKWLSADTEYGITVNVNLPAGCTATAVGMPDWSTVKIGDSLQRPEPPTLEGYLHAGWYTDEELTTKYVFGSKVYADLTLYAKWVEENAVFTFTYNPNVPTGLDKEATGVPAPAQVKAGEKVAEPEAPSLEGFRFVAWCSDETCRYKYNFSEGIYGDTQIFARWAIVPVTYTVTYNGNPPSGLEATNVPVSRTVREGKTTAEPTKVPRLKGYIFAGWCVDAACTSLYDFKAEVTADLTLYARWEKEITFKVIYDANIISGMGAPSNMPKDEELKEGTAYLKPVAVPKHKGYTFGGWYADAECTVPFDFFGSAESDVTVYAKWQKSPPDYALIFGLTIPAIVVLADGGLLAYVLISRKRKKRSAEIAAMIAEAEKED